MPVDVNVKICGLRTPADVAGAVAANARYVGLNFFAKSPRFLPLDDAVSVVQSVPVGVCKVALVVNVDNSMLDDLVAHVPLDMLQLHGSESPERVQEIKARYGLPVMKVVGVASADDLVSLETYMQVADQILVDAKPPKDAILPGGNGLAFDWNLIAGRKWAVPWMLAGGLNPGNVAQAIAMTGARQVDVASGVESAPGIKDAALMAAFCSAAMAA